jgi:hypothetical protein
MIGAGMDALSMTRRQPRRVQSLHEVNPGVGHPPSSHLDHFAGQHLGSPAASDPSFTAIAVGNELCGNLGDDGVMKAA